MSLGLIVIKIVIGRVGGRGRKSWWSAYDKSYETGHLRLEKLNKK